MDPKNDSHVDTKSHPDNKKREVDIVLLSRVSKGFPSVNDSFLLDQSTLTAVGASHPPVRYLLSAASFDNPHKSVNTYFPDRRPNLPPPTSHQTQFRGDVGNSPILSPHVYKHETTTPVSP